MTKLSPRALEQHLKAREGQKRCEEWLKKFLLSDQPKMFSKAELTEAAIKELQISKNIFDSAWVILIETMGRQDWYKPISRKKAPKNLN
jgi:hypothetical protein